MIESTLHSDFNDYELQQMWFSPPPENGALNNDLCNAITAEIKNTNTNHDADNLDRDAESSTVRNAGDKVEVFCR